MIVVGLTGGMGQGKSTVGAMLRQLAAVDYRADLENSYAIVDVANMWLATWPPTLQLGAGDLVELANGLIKTLPEILGRRTEKAVDADKLRITHDAASLELHNRLLHYLETWLALSAEEREVQLPVPITSENKGLHRALLQWLGGVTVAVVAPTIWADLLDKRIKELAGRGYKLVTVGGIRYSHDAAMLHANGGVLVHVERPETKLSSDVTETSMSELTADTEIINNGTLEQLQAVAANLYADLEADSVKPQYRAV